MHINKATNYAMRIVIYLMSKNEPVSSRVIGEETGISAPFTQNIMRKLKKNNLVSVKCGFDGGYSIAKSVDTITVKDILDAMDDKVYVNKELKEAGVKSEGTVSKGAGNLMRYYEFVQNSMKNMLSISLKELGEGNFFLGKVVNA